MRHIVGEAFGVRVAPLTADLAPRFAAATSLLDFRYYTVAPATFDADGWAGMIEGRNRPDAFGFASFGHALFVGDELVGMSSVFDIQPAHCKCEIGFTMVFDRWRGSQVNAASKLILMTALFEEHGFIRVQLKGDARNTPSMRAMLRMGFSLEGTLRCFQHLEAGYRRDVTFYSVLDHEWPRVKAHLEEMCRQRLAGVSPHPPSTS